MDDDKFLGIPQSDNSDCHPKRRWAAPRVINPSVGMDVTSKSVHDAMDFHGPSTPVFSC
jgi:hypothetical protein